jgi:hypothetical protein
MLVDALEKQAVPRHSYPHIHVERIPQIGPQSTRLTIGVSGKKGLRLKYQSFTEPVGANLQKFFVSPQRRRRHQAVTRIAVPQATSTRYHGYRFILRKPRPCPAQRTFFVRIVPVQPGVDVAGRPRETLLDRVRLPAILPALPIGEMRSVFFNDPYRSIGAPAVDDDILEVRVILQQYRTYRFFQVPALVQAWRDYR